MAQVLGSLVYICGSDWCRWFMNLTHSCLITVKNLKHPYFEYMSHNSAKESLISPSVNLWWQPTSTASGLSLPVCLQASTNCSPLIPMSSRKLSNKNCTCHKIQYLCLIDFLVSKNTIYKFLSICKIIPWNNFFTSFWIKRFSKQVFNKIEP